MEAPKMTGNRKSVPINRQRKANGEAPKMRQEFNLVRNKKPMGIHFQEEIILDILNKLPVRSLLRFKCVSKFWKTLISHPNFKKKHLIHANEDQNSQKFLVIQQWFGKDDMHKHNLYSSPLSLDQNVEDVQELDFPLYPKPVSCRMWCCYDGLFLLAISNGLDHYLTLWNPATRESALLPHPEFPINEFCTLGLGYDAISDDYKILKVDSSPFEEILTLKHGSWRALERPRCIHPAWSSGKILMDHPVFVHGAFHWLVCLRNYYVVSFSVSDEVYGDIPLLEGMCDANMRSRTIDRGVSEIDGMLCLNFTYDYQGEGTFKLWVMKDYGVKESWNILLTIRDVGLHAATPKYRFADGEVLLHCVYWGRIGSLFKTSKGPFGLWPQCGAFHDGFAYTESLISPKPLST